MKALVVDAKWQARNGYTIKDDERYNKRARSGCQVWRYPLFEIKEVAAPKITSDEVLIRVKRCGICGSDSHIYETDAEGYILFSGPAKFPCIIGHEYSGIVEELGEGVSTLRRGDMVAVESIHWCGKCISCRSGNFNQCEDVELTGITVDGALAEFVKAKERHCWSINSLLNKYREDDVLDIGAIVEPIGCAYNGMFIAAGGFKPGDSVVVYGVGPIGLGAVALAKTAGAGLIIAFDNKARRLEIAKTLGADCTYNLGSIASPSEIVLEATEGRGAQMQIEAAGAAPYTIPEMERSLSFNGKIVYLGRSSASSVVCLDNFVTGASSIIGARGHSGYGIYFNIIRLLLSDRFRIKDMITSYFSLDDAVEAIKKSTERTDGKILITV
ncbi:sorbitol dehydrogenase [Candidatus Magnetoovum chiemensis]|nr:sorbitol dehydrogenase [Candidatus Magnetoovum chiemensis]